MGFIAFTKQGRQAFDGDAWQSNITNNKKAISWGISA